MNRAMQGALVVLALLGSVASASPEGATAAAAVNEVDRQVQAALAKRDRAALEGLIARDFLWVHASDGRADTRDVWLDAAARGMALSGQRNERTEHGVSITTHGSPPHTALRVLRVRLRSGERESWLRQTQTFVREGAAWKLAAGQGVVMYDGPRLDPGLHARYAGTYVITPGRELRLTWDGESLLAALPGGARTQVFLASPTEEAVRVLAVGALRFALDADGRPVAAALVRNGEEIWRANRQGD